MANDRKTVYVNDKPISIFLWAEVQHCVNAFDSDLFLAVQAGDAEIVDGKGERIGWGGFASDGQRIYVRMNEIEEQPPRIPSWVKELIDIFTIEPVGNPPQSIWRYKYKSQTVYFIPRQINDLYSALYDEDGNQICSPDGGFADLGDGRCPDFFAARMDEILIWKDPRVK